jgi:hypothetical protein
MIAGGIFAPVCSFPVVVSLALPGLVARFSSLRFTCFPLEIVLRERT